MYYVKGTFPDSPQDGKSLKSLDAREIYNEIMKNLVPGLPTVTTSALKVCFPLCVQVINLRFVITPYYLYFRCRK